MPSTIGPLLSLEALAPSEWNSHQEDTLISLQDQNGYGWTVEVYSLNLRKKLLESSAPQRIFLAQVIREDAQSLFGFESLAERRIFMELRELDSIGPKIAALILASLSPDELSRMVTGELKQIPRKIPGLGPKMQEKLTLGLKLKRDRFMELMRGYSSTAHVSAASSASVSARHGSVPVFIIQSMEGLGLRASETDNLWQNLLREDPDFEQKDNGEMIRRLLQEWGRMKNKARPQSDTGSTF